MCKFGILIFGGSGRLAEFESHLKILLRDGCACGARVKFGIRNVRRAHLTDI